MIDRTLHALFGAPEAGRGGWNESRELEPRDPNRRRFPLQPRNTLSNLAYGAAGLWAVAIGAPVLGACLALLMVGSSLYHGWPTLGTNRVDHAGMQSTFATLLAIAVGVGGPELVVVAAGAAAVGAWRRPDAVLSLGVVILATMLVQYDPGIPPTGVLSLLFGVLSMGAWILDRNGTWTGKWGHAAFHVGTAVAIALMATAVA